jgi:hypothetical protein
MACNSIKNLILFISCSIVPDISSNLQEAARWDLSVEFMIGSPAAGITVTVLARKQAIMAVRSIFFALMRKL